MDSICRPHVCWKPKNKNPNPDAVQVIRAPHGRPDGKSFILERLKIIQLSAVCQLPGWEQVSIPEVTWPISSSSAWIGPLTHMLLLFLFSNFGCGKNCDFVLRCFCKSNPPPKISRWTVKFDLTCAVLPVSSQA